MKLYVTPGTPAARLPLIAAAYSKVDVVLVEEAAPEAVNPTGVLPCLDAGGGTVVFGAAAAARHIARAGAAAAQLLGSTPAERAAVDQWEAFACTELDMPCAMVSGVLPTRGAVAPSAAVEKQAREDIAAYVAVIDGALDGRSFLAGTAAPSLADIAVVAALYPAIKKDGKLLTKQSARAKAWYDGCTKAKEFAATLALSMTPPPPPSAAYTAALTKNPRDLQREINAKQLALDGMKGEEKKEAQKEIDDMYAAMLTMLPITDEDRSKKKSKAEYKKTKDVNMDLKRVKKSKPPTEKAVEYTEKTPKGEKKIQQEMLPTYSAKVVESAWYEWWEKEGLFQPPPRKKGEKTFTIVIPPPNVTGNLHLGHALTNSIQDCLVRWHRQRGEAALWVPGTDHAGIATQVVVEKKIMREEGKTRHDYGRDEFIKKVWQWKEVYGNNITTQLRRLGSSTDWSREVFTMDDKLSVAVKEAFVRMFADGLIYRSTRLVNWSCTLKTAISDIEVDYITLEGPTPLKVPGHGDKKYIFGTLIAFAYPVYDDPTDEIVVATTRIETMLADTGVAIHPRDPRYLHLHGKFVKHPIDGRKIPIVLDNELVDMSFGTGAVKVTPAHDPNDYIVGKKHGLEFVSMFDDEGIVTSVGGKYAGRRRFDVREAVVEELKGLGLYRGTTPNPGMRLGLCNRSGDVVEPIMRPQWFCDCKDMAKQAADAVRNGDLTLIPESANQTWFTWLDNIQDWCISRQLWWGHRIPAYYVQFKGEKRGEEEDTDRWVVGRTEEEARATAAKKFNRKAKDIVLTQDPDVLDTWFSSGLFPFSVMGWPEKTEDLDRFYPTSLLETGHDIIFFWVARMVMMGLQLTKKLPFKTVYLHAMVRDAHGRKMAKSLGNVINPLDVINGCSLEGLHETLRNSNLAESELNIAIKGQKADFPYGFPECGADALRFGLLAYSSQGRDINLDVDVVVGWRNFCNKLWNATRFALASLGDGFVPAPQKDAEVAAKNRGAADRWILACSSRAGAATDAALAAYDFSAATGAVHHFWLRELCDYYLEITKPIFQGKDEKAKAASRETLYTCLERGLRMLAPFMPFLSEELWQRLPRRKGDKTISVHVAQFPTRVAAWEDDVLCEQFSSFQNLVHAARSLRAQYSINNKQLCTYTIDCRTGAAAQATKMFAPYIETLAGAETVKVEQNLKAPPAHCSPMVVDADTTIYIYLKGIVDPEKELAKLTKTQTALEKKVKSLAAMLKDPKFLQKAPAEQQELTKNNLKEAENTLISCKANIESFKAML